MAYAPTRLAGAKPIGGDRQPRTPLDSYYTAAPAAPAQPNFRSRSTTPYLDAENRQTVTQAYNNPQGAYQQFSRALGGERQGAYAGVSMNPLPTPLSPRDAFNSQYGQQLGTAMASGTPGQGLMTNEQASVLGKYQNMPNVTVGGAYGRGPSGNMADMLRNRLADTTDPGALGALRSRIPIPGAVPSGLAGAGSQGAGIWSTRTSSKTQAERQKLVEQNAMLRGSQRKDRLAQRKAVPTVMDMLAQQNPELAFQAHALQQEIGLKRELGQGQLANDAAKTALLGKELNQQGTDRANSHALAMKEVEAKLTALSAQAQRDVSQHGEVMDSTKRQHEQAMEQFKQQQAQRQQHHEETMAQFNLTRQDKLAGQATEMKAARLAFFTQNPTATEADWQKVSGQPAAAAPASTPLTTPAAASGIKQGTGVEEQEISAAATPTAKRDVMRRLGWSDEEISKRLSRDFNNNTLGGYARSFFTGSKATPPTAAHPEGETDFSPTLPVFPWTYPGTAVGAYRWATGNK